MKKLIITIVLAASFFYSNAQQLDNLDIDLKRNEVRINGLYLVLGAFEGSYSYVLNDESTVGISLLLPFDDDISYDLNYYVSPYYRFFFGKKPAAGFFLEGFGMLNSIKDRNTFLTDINGDVVETTKEENITDFALGIGLGGKFITKRGLIGEVNFGVGRNLFNGYDNGSGTDIVAKFGVSLGYRF